jgi:hypothetical protein
VNFVRGAGFFLWVGVVGCGVLGSAWLACEANLTSLDGKGLTKGHALHSTSPRFRSDVDWNRSLRMRSLGSSEQQVSITAYTSLKLNSSSEVHLSRNLHTCLEHGRTTTPQPSRAPLMLLLLTLLEHLLHNLLLLDQKRPHNSILDAIRTSRSSVRALDGFLGLGDVGVFAGAEGGDLL